MGVAGALQKAIWRAFAMHAHTMQPQEQQATQSGGTHKSYRKHMYGACHWPGMHSKVCTHYVVLACERQEAAHLHLCSQLLTWGLLIR